MTQHGIPESALDNHVAILGKTGSGKTNLAKVIAEDLLEQDRRVCVIDPTGAWWGLRLMADGKTPSGHSCVIFGGQHGDLALSGSNGEAIAKVVSTTSTPAIIDVRTLARTDQARFFTDFADALISSNRGELTLIIDEAHKFMPQAGSGAGKASTTMLHAGNNLVSLGRGVGLRIILICQRPSKLHKDALTQVETLVSMRFTAPQDHKAIEAWVEEETSDDFDPAQLKRLPVGDAWVWYPEKDFFKLVHTPLASTYNSSRVRSQEIPDLPKIDVAAIESLLKQDSADVVGGEPKTLRRRIRELERELRTKKSSVVDESEIAQRVEAAVAAERKRLTTEMRVFLSGVSRQIDKFEKKFDVVSTNSEKHVDIAKTSKRNDPASRNGERDSFSDRSDLTGPQQRVLNALGWLGNLGITERANRVQVAFLSGYKPKGGAFNNTISSLRSRGLVEYPGQSEIALTAEGREYVPLIEKPLTTEELQDAVMERLNGPQRRILKPLIQVFPDFVDLDELASASGYERGGAFNNAKSSLRSLGLIEYPVAGFVVAREVLFLD